MSNIYKQGLNRIQQQIFPPSIDEYVKQDNPVRHLSGIHGKEIGLIVFRGEGSKNFVRFEQAFVCRRSFIGQ